MGDMEIASKGCGNCGATSFEGANFCSECGQSFVPPPEQTTRTLIKHFASGTATEIKNTAHDALRSDLGKKMAAGAALGAMATTVIPFVGWTTGAVLGAGFIAYKRLTK